jgi:hypothetical protein
MAHVTEQHDPRRDASADDGLLVDALADEMSTRLGAAAPLDAPIRRAFEGRLGTDLSATMVHRSPFAGRVARALGAEALSVGGHILGAADQLNAASPAGQALLRHEVAHVVQRAGSGVVDPAEEEYQALSSELASDDASGADGTGPIDLDLLTELVYRRWLDEVRLEGARAGWLD